MVPEMVFPVKTLSDFGMSLSSLTSIVQEVMLKNKVRDAIVGAYGQVTIGNPLDEKTQLVLKMKCLRYFLTNSSPCHLVTP